MDILQKSEIKALERAKFFTRELKKRDQNFRLVDLADHEAKFHACFKNFETKADLSKKAKYALKILKNVRSKLLEFTKGKNNIFKV